MHLKQLVNASCVLATVLLFSAGTVSTQAASLKAEDQHRDAAGLLREIKADAAQVRSAAMRLNALTRASNVKWLEYDKQWNEIKPAVEDMDMKLTRLERMQSALAPAERDDMNKCRPLIQEIRSDTHELRTLLDQPGVQLTDKNFHAEARGLLREAVELEQAARPS